jgi:hypothetical protein
LKSRILILGLLLAVTSPVFAADVDGKWTGPIDTPGGPVQVYFTFMSNGASLTGSTTGPDGAVVPIKGGKISGSNISFTADVEFGGSATTITYSGVVSPAEIKIHMEFMGMPMDLTVKKTT